MKTNTLAQLVPAGLAISACAVLAGAPQAQPGSKPRVRTSNTQQSFITRKLEKSVDRGLKFLASRQDRAGYWSQDIGFKLNSDYEVERASAPHVGVTALAGIAFLAGGHLPER